MKVTLPKGARRRFLTAIGFAIFTIACSSAPQNPGDVYDLRGRAETQLDRGNQQANRGNFDMALTLLDEAMRLAVVADDSGLRIRAGLSRGNVFFSMGRQEEAAQAWSEALAEAKMAAPAGNSELAAICRIHIARGRLLSSSGKADGAAVAQSVRDEVSRDLPLIKSDRLYIAFAWTVAALAEKELGHYAAAETAAKRSLEIHEKDRYLELAAYDWFLIASCRSLSGNYPGAIQALETAINYDRRVENSWGLASDWRALGDVHRKAGDSEAARAAYLRAAEIFRALGDEASAGKLLP